MKKYKLALFIGRFQPFHNGHLYSLNICFDIADRVLIGVGSSNISRTENNPWDYETRKKMIEVVLRGPRLRDHLQAEVVAVPDVQTDAEWVALVEAILMKYELGKQEIVVVSNNEWVTRLMSEAGYAIYETGLYNRDELEGTKIREMMRRGDEGWKSRVPADLCKIV